MNLRDLDFYEKNALRSIYQYKHGKYSKRWTRQTNPKLIKKGLAVLVDDLYIELTKEGRKLAKQMIEGKHNP